MITRQEAAAVRIYYQGEIETMIRQLKIDGATLEDCVAELKILADFVRSQADNLESEWPNLLEGTRSQTMAALHENVSDLPQS